MQLVRSSADSGFAMNPAARMFVFVRFSNRLADVETRTERDPKEFTCDSSVTVSSCIVPFLSAAPFPIDVGGGRPPTFGGEEAGGLPDRCRIR